MVPKSGVYSISATVTQTTYQGVLYIRNESTLNTPYLEIHLINFKDKIAEQGVKIELTDRIKDEFIPQINQRFIEQFHLEKKITNRV